MEEAAQKVLKTKPEESLSTRLRLTLPRNISSFYLLLLAAVVFMLVLLGVFSIQRYFILERAQSQLPEAESIEPKSPADEFGTRYYQGTNFYEQGESGTRELLVIEGKAKEINLEARYIVIENNNVEEKILYFPEDNFEQLILLQNPEGGLPFVYQPIAPDQIRVGDRVAYHPPGLNPDKVGHWVIQKPVR